MTNNRPREFARRSLTWGTCLAIGAAAALSITGCSTTTAQAGATTKTASPAAAASSSSASPSASAAAPTASAQPTASAATGAPSSAALEAMLQHATVPALCDHSAGTLANGRLPNQSGHPGTVALAWEVGEDRSQAALSSVGLLEGSGSHDVVAGLYCDAGGVPWPEVVGVWRWTGGSTLQFVAVYAPQQLSHNIVSLSTVAVAGNAIDIAWSGPAPGKDDADGSEHSSAVLTLANGQLAASSYKSTVS